MTCFFHSKVLPHDRGESWRVPEGEKEEGREERRSNHGLIHYVTGSKLIQFFHLLLFVNVILSNEPVDWSILCAYIVCS